MVGFAGVSGLHPLETKGALVVGKICVVTGANAGIGYVTALELARMGATVVMLCRSRERGEAAQAAIVAATGNRQVELILADFSALSSVRAAATTLLARQSRIDVLVNNAGLYVDGQQHSADGYELMFAVNHLAPFLFTNLLLDTLKATAPARIVTVASSGHTSGRGRFDARLGCTAEGFRAYAESKLANVLFTYELARRLEGSGVTANCLHPGVVRTNLATTTQGLFSFVFGLFRPFMLTPEQGAQTSIYLASAAEVEGVTGKYFANRRAVSSSLLSHDQTRQQHLWNLSEDLVQTAASIGA